MSTATPSRHRNAPLELRIQNRGLLDHGSGGVAVVLGVVAIAGVVAYSTEWFYGIAAAAILMASAWRCFVPVLFEFGPLGIAQRAPWRRTRRIAWNEMGRIDFLSRGLLITVNPSQPLSSLRSVYIRYAGKRKELERLVQTYVQPRRPSGPPVPSPTASTTDFSVDDNRPRND